MTPVVDVGARRYYHYLERSDRKIKRKVLTARRGDACSGIVEASTTDRERGKLCRLCFSSESVVRHGGISRV